jgi:hypothetical protein
MRRLQAARSATTIYSSRWSKREEERRHVIDDDEFSIGNFTPHPILRVVSVLV